MVEKFIGLFGRFCNLKFSSGDGEEDLDDDEGGSGKKKFR